MSEVQSVAMTSAAKQLTADGLFAILDAPSDEQKTCRSSLAPVDPKRSLWASHHAMSVLVILMFVPVTITIFCMLVTRVLTKLTKYSPATRYTIARRIVEESYHILSTQRISKASMMSNRSVEGFDPENPPLW